MDDFRRRRARLRRQPDSNSILKLDFDRLPVGSENPLPAESREPRRAADVAEPAPEVDATIENVPVAYSEEQRDADEWLRKTDEKADGLLSGRRPARMGAQLEGLESDVARGRAGAAEPELGPLEISLDISPSLSDASAAESIPTTLKLATRGKRFLAGVLDAVILLLGYGLLAVVFWRLGGKPSLRLGFLAPMGFMAVLMLVAYFALEVGFTSTTPGLLAMGLEIRRMDGHDPTPGDAFVRAFGVLISLAAFGLGFAWSLVDSETLTWHDRMSRTVIVVKEVEEPKGED